MSGAALVRLRSTRGVNADGTDASETGYAYYNASASGGGTMPLDGGAAAFYAFLFGEAAAWNATLVAAARVRLPGAEGARQVDTMWGSLVAALGLYVGNSSNYGDGKAYWAPGGSLTSEVQPVVEVLVSLGLRNAAAGIVALYFDVFIRADGSLPECDDCAAGGFGDALADYGEMIEVFGRTARALLDYDGGGSAWVAARLPAFARLANKTLALRLNATAHGAPAGDATHGLVFGSPEHDTCREPGYYYREDPSERRTHLCYLFRPTFRPNFPRRSPPLRNLPFPNPQTTMFGCSAVCRRRPRYSPRSVVRCMRRLPLPLPQRSHALPPTSQHR